MKSLKISKISTAIVKLIFLSTYYKCISFILVDIALCIAFHVALYCQYFQFIMSHGAYNTQKNDILVVVRNFSKHLPFQSQQ